MASPKRTKMQRENDRYQTAKLHIEGQTQQAIAEVIGVSRPQIQYDLRIIRGQWREVTALNLDEHRAKELARLDVLEATYWQAWKRSLEPSGRDGTTAFLDGILRCVDRRCKLLGLDAPVKADVAHHDGLAGLSKLMYERQMLNGGSEHT